MNGFLNLLKPPGLTSHDAVAVVRRCLHERRVGHLGTLDPAAAGVLPMAVGVATRLIKYIATDDAAKQYVTVLRLGVVTDTQDATGQVVSTAAVNVTRPQLEAAIAAHTGDLLQIPPMASALHHGSVRLYELFRQGIEVPREARPIQVPRIDLLDFNLPDVRLRIDCSAGTYVRTLCHDIGAWLGCGGTMAFLVRTRSGPFSIEGSVTLEETTPHVLWPSTDALAALPAVQVKTSAVARVRSGSLLSIPHIESSIPQSDLVRLMEGSTLLAVARQKNGSLHPECVLI